MGRCETELGTRIIYHRVHLDCVTIAKITRPRKHGSRGSDDVNAFIVRIKCRCTAGIIWRRLVFFNFFFLIRVRAGEQWTSGLGAFMCETSCRITQDVHKNKIGNVLANFRKVFVGAMLFYVDAFVINELYFTRAETMFFATFLRAAAVMNTNK